MASIRKRGSNSYLIVVSRGYDYEGNRLKSVQKTVKPPKEYTPKQAEKWVREQAMHLTKINAKHKRNSERRLDYEKNQIDPCEQKYPAESTRTLLLPAKGAWA